MGAPQQGHCRGPRGVAGPQALVRGPTGSLPNGGVRASRPLSPPGPGRRQAPLDSRDAGKMVEGLRQSLSHCGIRRWIQREVF